MTIVFEMGRLRLQKQFLQHTESWIRRLYGIVPDEIPLCALWLGRRSRKGFVVTNKALHWNIGSRMTATCGCLEKSVDGEAVVFSVETILPEAVALSPENVGNDRLTKITIRGKNSEQSFYFKKLEEKHAEIMLDILKFGLNQGTVPQIDLSEFIVEVQPSEIQNLLDCFLWTCSNLKQKAKKFFSLLQGKFQSSCTIDASVGNESARAEGSQSEEREASSDGAASGGLETRAGTSELGSKQRLHSARIFFAHLFDFIASFIFILAIIIAVKPELLTETYTPRFVGKVTEFVGGGLLQFTIKTMVVPEDGLMLARNFFVTTSLIVFLLMKILAVVLSQGTKRFVALIMLVMTLLSCWLISDKFLLFITFCLLLNIGFQILCNFQAKTIRNKLIWLLVLTLVCYVTIHILQLKEVKDILSCIGMELKRIWCLLASLFHQLSFPVLLW